MYGNLKGLEMCARDKVMWYTFGLGTEVDIHGVHFEGNTFKKQSTTRDTLNLFPHTTAAVFMQPNIPGQITSHMNACLHKHPHLTLPCISRNSKNFTVLFRITSLGTKKTHFLFVAT